MELSNAELQVCFQNYHRALYDELYRDPRETVLTVKCSNGKNIKVLVEPSFTIYYVKLNIEYAHGRHIYPLEQQILKDGDLLLEDEVALTDTKILRNGYLLLDMRSGSKKLEEEEETTDSTKEIQKSVLHMTNESKDEDLVKEGNETPLSRKGIKRKNCEMEGPPPQHEKEDGEDGELFLDEANIVEEFPVDEEDASLVPTGGGDDKGFLWRIGHEDWAFELQGHGGSICCLTFSTDGQLLASPCWGGLTKIWDIPSHNLKFSLDGPGEGIEWIKWHPRGHLVLASSEDSTVWMWNADKGACLNTFLGHGCSVTCCDFTPDGKVVNGFRATLGVDLHTLLYNFVPSNILFRDLHCKFVAVVHGMYLHEFFRWIEKIDYVHGLVVCKEICDSAFGWRNIDEEGNVGEFAEKCKGKKFFAHYLFDILPLKVVFEPFDRGRERIPERINCNGPGVIEFLKNPSNEVQVVSPQLHGFNNREDDGEPGLGVQCMKVSMKRGWLDFTTVGEVCFNQVNQAILDIHGIDVQFIGVTFLESLVSKFSPSTSSAMGLPREFQEQCRRSLELDLKTFYNWARHVVVSVTNTIIESNSAVLEVKVYNAALRLMFQIRNRDFRYNNHSRISGISVFSAVAKHETDSPRRSESTLVQPDPAWREVLTPSGYIGCLLSLYVALRQKFSCEGYWIDCPIAVGARQLILKSCSLTGTIFIFDNGKIHEHQLLQLPLGMIDWIDPPDVVSRSIECTKSESERLDGCRALLSVANVISSFVFDQLWKSMRPFGALTLLSTLICEIIKVHG